MIAADETAIVFITFLAVVGHVDDDGIFFLVATDDLVHDRVVVEHGIVVLTQHFTLPVGELRRRSS